jgi:hypothetical protein
MRSLEFLLDYVNHRILHELKGKTGGIMTDHENRVPGKSILHLQAWE